MTLRLAILLFPAVLAAQPAFEAAVVKPADPAASGFSRRTWHSQIEWRNCSLRQCMEAGWELRDYAFSGPPWLDSVHFDIVAKLPEGASPSQAVPMMRTLLVERFELRTHTEMRDVPGYALTVARDGPKLKRSESDQSSTSYGNNMVRCRGVEMAVFLDQLSRSIGRPVTDETGLAGRFDFELRWAPDIAATPGADTSEPGPSLLTAIQQQLGLKLVAKKLPVSVLVVDSARREPTEN